MIFDSFLNSATKNLADSIPVTKLMGVGSNPVHQSVAPNLNWNNNYPGSQPTLYGAQPSPLQTSQPGFLSFLNPSNLGDAGLPGLGFQMPNFGGLAPSQSIYQGISALPTSIGGSDTSGPSIPASGAVPPPPNLPTGPATPSPITGNGIVDAAARQTGQPYVWGGTGANSGGYDCSGLTQYAYAQNGISIPRTSQQQYNYVAAKGGLKNSIQDLKPGDLIFFANTYNDPSGPITHVGIYQGNNKMINAPVEGQPVQSMDISPYWMSHFAGGGS